MRRRKTKFPTIKLPIYLPKWQIWMQLSPKWFTQYLSKECKTGMFVKYVEYYYPFDIL